MGIEDGWEIATGRLGSPTTGRRHDATLAGGGAMGDLIRRLDWSQSVVGPALAWPQSLRTAVSILLASRFPMIIFWGPEFVQFYNDAYRPMLGATKHPAALGQRARDCWPEIWNLIGPMLDGVLQQGVATWSADQLLLLDRNGYVEECYFTFSYSPIRIEAGAVGGVFCAVTETTAQVLGERRVRTLRDLAASGVTDSIAQACQAAVDALAGNRDDLPFAALYTIQSECGIARLAAVTGVVAGCAWAPSEIVLAAPGPGEDLPIWPAVDGWHTGQAALVEYAGQALPHQPAPMVATFNRALVLPVARAGQERPAALLVVGLNPRRALNDDYRGFLDLVAGQVAMTLDRARAFQEAKERAEALAELDRAKTVFFSNVSHEFRTPLTLLLAPTEDALADVQAALPEVQRDRLEIVRRNGLRMLRLVNTLLDFSRLEAGRVRACYRPTDLAALTDDVAAAFRSPIEHAGLAYTVTCRPLHEPVYVDRELWEKVVLNLLSNAFKFTVEGGISVELQAAGEAAELTIHDSGVGIAEAELLHIFERFHRIGGVRARTQEGTGIGLSLVRELVALHRGTTTASSVPAVGSTFTVRIPFGTAHLPADQLGEEDPPAAGVPEDHPLVVEAQQWSTNSGEVGARPPDIAAPGPVAHGLVSAETPGAEPPRQFVLLVDDNADMRQYLGRLLGRYWTVEVVAEGTAALAAALARRPNLVLTDVMLPGMDGFQLLRALRNDPRTRDVPVILLSARAGEEATVEGLDAGADDYLIKPFTARELVARVRTHLELGRIRAEVALLQDQALAEAREAVRLRDDVLTNAAHDLRNPLTAIQGYSQLLRRQVARGTASDSARMLANLEAIQETVNAMREQLDELHDLAQLQIGRPLILQCSPVDLAELIHQVTTVQQHATDDQQLEIRQSPVPLVGAWDAVRLRRVLTNLLENAIKYSPAGSSIWIESTPATGEHEQSGAVVTVRDNGVGIPEDDLPYIFEQNRRARNVGHIAGTGVGLASARQIVEQHGGAITVQSSEGQGSTFTVYLPFQGPSPSR